MQALLPLMSYVLPLVGKLLLMIPVVPNRVIPFVLGSLNVAHKYWILAGFPAWLNVGSVDSQMHYAAFGFLTSALPAIWGVAESYLFHRFYESKKLEARAKKQVSWWEKHKASIYK